MTELPTDIIYYIIAPFDPEAFFMVNRALYHICASRAMLDRKRAQIYRWLKYYSKSPRRAPYYFSDPAPIVSEPVCAQITSQLGSAKAIAFISMQDSLEMRSKYEIVAVWRRYNGTFGWLQVNDLSDFTLRRQAFTNVGPIPTKETQLGPLFIEMQQATGPRMGEVTMRMLVRDQIEGRHQIRMLRDEWRYVLISKPIVRTPKRNETCRLPLPM
jgi:hypothetical protein